MREPVTYAIGDVHGCLDLLDRMLAAMESDTAGRDAHVVLLGDYVDRGPYSKGVIERLLAPPSWARFTCLMGNHERVMLDALAGDVAAKRMWMDGGARDTLASYGAPDVESLARIIPPEHVAWIKSLPLWLDDGQRFFVHAGIRPGVPLKEQVQPDVFWIRSRFLDSDVDHGRLVVHGHTIVSSPEIRRNRVNLDTGAFDSGTLTGAAFDPGLGEPRIIKVRRPMKAEYSR